MSTTAVTLLVLLAAGSFGIIFYHLYRFVSQYRLNKQVQDILASRAIRAYQINQEIGDQIAREKESKEGVIDDLSKFRLEKISGSSRYTKIQDLTDDDVEWV